MRRTYFHSNPNHTYVGPMAMRVALLLHYFCGGYAQVCGGYAQCCGGYAQDCERWKVKSEKWKGEKVKSEKWKVVIIYHDCDDDPMHHDCYDDQMHLAYIFSKWINWKSIFPKCIYPKCISAKCTRLACLLSFASLFHQITQRQIQIQTRTAFTILVIFFLQFCRHFFNTFPVLFVFVAVFYI